MKTTLIVLFLVVITACSQGVPSVPMAAEFEEAVTAVTADCTSPVDPQVMLDAFPTSFGSYVEVGETIAEQSEMPMPNGIAQQSTALRTLTINDEQYISFVGTDGCGFNTNQLQIAMMEEREDEYGWSKKITVAGYDGWLVYDSGAELYDVLVLLNERALITTNSDESESIAIEAAASVDYASIETAMQ